MDLVSKMVDVGNMGVFLRYGGCPHMMYRWAGLHMDINNSGGGEGDVSARNNDNNITPSQSSQSNLTAPNQSSQSNLTAPSQTIQPGYSRAQLYVKSRQLLWEVLSGALAASTVAVDWRGVIQLSQVTTLTLSLLSPSLCYLHSVSNTSLTTPTSYDK